jgi:hypothetical protein
MEINLDSPTITIVECSKCKAPQVFKPLSMDLDIPVALEVTVDGGYNMFIDNIFEPPIQFMLCHKCAHEFIDWLDVPETTVSKWHPKTDDPYCNGWTMLDATKKHISILKAELSDLIYINEYTMIEPFDDYKQKKAQIEELIRLEEERLAEYEQK